MKFIKKFDEFDPVNEFTIGNEKNIVYKYVNDKEEELIVHEVGSDKWESAKGLSDLSKIVDRIRSELSSQPVGITKNRLNRLIKEKKTIYGLKHYDMENSMLHVIDLSKDVNIITNEKLYGKHSLLSFEFEIDGEDVKDIISLNLLFEDETVAEHYEKYDNISSVSYLKIPPMYDEFKDIKKYHMNSGNIDMVLKLEDNKLKLFKSDNTPGEVDINLVFELEDNLFNYNKCLDEIVKIWKKVKRN